jgi:hypothetical protein
MFKERQLFLDISLRVIARHVVALNAGVMRRFERVVALPDPKILNFPSRNALFGLQFRPSDAIKRTIGDRFGYFPGAVSPEPLGTTVNCINAACVQDTVILAR